MNTPKRDRPRALRAVARVVAILMATLLASPAPAAQPEWDLLAGMPADATVVVLVEDLSSALRSRPGQSLRAAIEQSGLFAQTLSRARELAETLQLSPDEAADALLGQRAVLVARGPDRHARAGSAPDWTLATTISPKLRQRIIDRLAAAPRDKIEGQLVLAIEHGRFVLTMIEQRDPRGRERTTLVLAPQEASSLFADIVRRHVAGPKAKVAGVLGESDEFAIARDLPAGSVLAFVRTPASTDISGAIAASASRTDHGWRVNLAIGTPGWAPDAHVPGFDPSIVEDLEQDALALILESLPDARPRDPPHDDRHAAVWPTFIALPGELATLLDGRAIARVIADAPGEGVVLTIASDLEPHPDATARVDRAIAAMLAPDSEEDRSAFDGEFPEAVRTEIVPMGADTPIGREALAAWSFALAETDSGRAPTWWALQLSPDPGRDTGAATARLRNTVTRLGEIGNAPAEQAVCAAGVLRPSKLLATIGASPWTDLPPVQAMRWFDQIRWRLQERRPGARPGRCGITSGWVEVRMADPPDDDPRTPGPGAP